MLEASMRSSVLRALRGSNWEKPVVLLTNPRPPDAVRCGDLALHPGTARAEWRGHDIGLTLNEYKVVSMLVAAAGEGGELPQHLRQDSAAKASSPARATEATRSMFVA